MYFKDHLTEWFPLEPTRYVLDAIQSYNFGSRYIFVNKVLMEKIKPHIIWRLN